VSTIAALSWALLSCALLSTAPPASSPGLDVVVDEHPTTSNPAIAQAQDFVIVVSVCSGNSPLLGPDLLSRVATLRNE
jgi:hypothetical protein